jgi:hypothetical protein
VKPNPLERWRDGQAQPRPGTPSGCLIPWVKPPPNDLKWSQMAILKGVLMGTIWKHDDQPSNFWGIQFSDKTKCDGLWCSKPSAITLDTKVIMIREYQNVFFSRGKIKIQDQIRTKTWSINMDMIIWLTTLIVIYIFDMVK